MKAKPDHIENLMIAGLIVLAILQAGLMVWGWIN